ncbi:MAG: response regulator transcription factor [Anaerolineae bacterium]|nr:response regulator transcription factor [Anaerolineae bacterium]
MTDAAITIRILIADDHPIVRDGLSAVLSTQPDFEVVGEATNGEELLTKAQALNPTIILTDLEMPIIDGVEAIKRLHDTLPAVRIIVLTAFNTDDKIVSSIRAGAQGYLLKGAPRAEIFNAIRTVAAGGSLLSPVVVSTLLEHVRDPQADAPDTLTEREMEVLRLIAQGLANKEIAAQLNVTERTVKAHASAIMGKLGAGNRTEAVRMAVQRGLIEL